MTNLASFAELMKLAATDKAARAVAESERKKTEVAPLLSELFSTVSTAKKITEKRAAVIDKIDELEANQITEEDITELVDSKVDKIATDTEKKLVAIVKKLQDDITNLKRHVDSKPSGSSGWGSSGGGEVKILRMDDIDLSNLAHDAVMTYNSIYNKLNFYQIHDKVFSNVINKPTTIMSDMSYNVLSYIKIKSTLNIKGNLGIR